MLQVFRGLPLLARVNSQLGPFFERSNVGLMILLRESGKWRYMFHLLVDWRLVCPDTHTYEHACSDVNFRPLVIILHQCCFINLCIHIQFGIIHTTNNKQIKII